MKDLKNKRISGYREKYCSSLKRNVPILCCRENGRYTECCEADCSEKEQCAYGKADTNISSFCDISSVSSK